MLKPKKFADLDVGRTYNHRIEIFENEREEGPHETIDDWIPFDLVWADKEFNRRKNYYSQDAPNVEYDSTFVLHYREDLDESMMIKHGGKEYRILGIYPTDNEKLNISIDVKEVKRAI